MSNEINVEDFLAGLDDDAAVESMINTMATEGVSTEAPTVAECKVVALLTKLELKFSLSKGYLADPANWTPSPKAFNKDPFWANLVGHFESQSAEVRALLGRDTNPSYRVGGFDSKTLRKFPANIAVVTSSKPNEAGQVKPIGIDFTNGNFAALLGEILSQFGYAEKIAGTSSYTFSKEFFEVINNGVPALKASLAEKARAGEAISEDAAKNDLRLIPYFIAAKQLENLSEVLSQRPDSDRAYVITIGRRARENDSSKQENYVKDFVHTASESGQAALAEVLN